MTQLAGFVRECVLEGLALRRGAAFKRPVFAAWVWRTCHYPALYSYPAFFFTLLTNFALTNVYPRRETKEREGDLGRPEPVAALSVPRQRGVPIRLQARSSARRSVRNTRNAIQLNGK